MKLTSKGEKKKKRISSERPIIKTVCIHCEREFIDRSIDGTREYCYREDCERIEESLDNNRLDINNTDEWN